MKTRKSYAYQCFCIPLRFQIANITTKTNKIHFHKFALLGDVRGGTGSSIFGENKTQSSKQGEEKSESIAGKMASLSISISAEWSVHNPISFGFFVVVFFFISWPAVTYIIMNAPWIIIAYRCKERPLLLTRPLESPLLTAGNVTARSIMGLSPEGKLLLDLTVILFPFPKQKYCF